MANKGDCTLFCINVHGK